MIGNLALGQESGLTDSKWIFLRYDSLLSKIDFTHTPSFETLFRFKDSEYSYEDCNTHTGSYSIVNDSIYIKTGLSTPKCCSGLLGFKEHLYQNKIWKRSSVSKVKYEIKSDSLLLSNDDGEHWLFVDQKVFKSGTIP